MHSIKLLLLLLLVQQGALVQSPQVLFSWNEHQPLQVFVDSQFRRYVDYPAGAWVTADFVHPEVVMSNLYCQGLHPERRIMVPGLMSKIDWHDVIGLHVVKPVAYESSYNSKTQKFIPMWNSYCEGIMRSDGLMDTTIGAWTYAPVSLRGKSGCLRR